MPVDCLIGTSKRRVPIITLPFLWRSQGGCVYLRNEDGCDIIIGPRVADKKLGRLVPACNRPSMGDAWERRLEPDETVTIWNT